MTDRDDRRNDDRVDLYGDPIRRSPGDWHPGEVQERWRDNGPYQDRTPPERPVRRPPQTREERAPERDGPARLIPLSQLGEHYGRGPRGYWHSDERIQEDVNERLSDNGDLDASRIEVSVQGAEVTLAGQVERRADKRLAEDLAEGVRGVRDVHNRLRVDPTS